MNDWIQFDSDDDCEDCNGGDGISQRCECGNRRVAWECLKDTCTCVDGEESECPYANASAY